MSQAAFAAAAGSPGPTNIEEAIAAVQALRVNVVSLNIILAAEIPPTLLERHRIGQAFSLLEACTDESHSPEAQLANARCLLHGLGTQANPQLAMTTIRRLVNDNYAPAQSALGHCYLTGAGVEEDKAAAFQYYQQAADQDFAEALYNLGVCYKDGFGTKKNPAQAFHYFRLAADQGFAPAQNNLGFCYDNGFGTEENHAQAFHYYKLAADQGFAPAQNNLGFCYLDGEGTEKDRGQALECFRQAADQGYDLAILNLARCLESDNPEEAARLCREITHDYREQIGAGRIDDLPKTVRDAQRLLDKITRPAPPRPEIGAL